MKIYLVRHAEAEGNIKEFFQGRVNTELTEKGKKQLECLAERFRDIPIERLYSSPLNRALSTAAAVNMHHGLPVEIREDLIEIDGGDWETKKWAELPDLYPEQYEMWKTKINCFQAPFGESTQQVYDRMARQIDALAAENAGRTIAVVSHGMAIKAYLNYADGRAWENYADPGWADNTAVSLIEYGDDIKPHIIFKNDSSHLTPELSTLSFSRWNKDTAEKGGQQ
ncbi:MAG: histidine phosphatase family protein [Huintestinicola sp.]